MPESEFKDSSFKKVGIVNTHSAHAYLHKKKGYLEPDLSKVLRELKEENFLIPYLEPKETSLKEQMVSFPISIDYDLWWKIAEEKNIG